MKSNVGPIQKENEDLTADAKEMADLLAKQYSKVFSRPPESPVDPKILFTDDKNWKPKDIKFNVDDFTQESDTTSPYASSGPMDFLLWWSRSAQH